MLPLLASFAVVSFIAGPLYNRVGMRVVVGVGTGFIALGAVLLALLIGPGADYLDVAPRVVRVALDAPVADVDIALPTAVADTRLLSELASTYGVTNPINRVLAALQIP